MMWQLPTSVDISGKKYNITNECDYQVVLDCINALNDDELDFESQITCALIIFYEEHEEILSLDKEHIITAIKEMNNIINGGVEEQNKKNQKPIVDFVKDFSLIATALIQILGYDIRTPNKYTHWWTFLSAFKEIKSGFYYTVLQIRLKISKGISLDKQEQHFYSENFDIIEIKQKFTKEEEEFFSLFE